MAEREKLGVNRLWVFITLVKGEKSKENVLDIFENEGNRIFGGVTPGPECRHCSASKIPYKLT